MADDLSFDITSHGDNSGFDKMARAAQETALKIEAANLRVERATKRATDAETKYEKGSLQAREASAKLSAAQLNLSKVMDAASVKVDEAKDKVEKLDVAEKKTSETTKKVDKDTNHLSGTMGKLGTSLGSAALGAVKGVGALASLASVAVTGGIAVAKLAIATVHYAEAIAPAAAALVPLAAGILLVKATVVAAGPAMLKSISPITAAWTKQTTAVGKLASAGLKPLAQAFVKANFPAIRSAMDSIAKSTNQAASFALKWANSASGQKVIAQVAGDAADAYKRLAPYVTAVGISLANMAGRISKVSFKNFDDAAQWALGKLNGLIDRISAADVQKAFDKMKSAGEAAGKGFRMLGDGLKYAQAHMDTINQIRTAVAGLSIVIGIATGGWLIALGGAITLVVMNWGKLTAAFKSAGTWISNLGAKFPSLTGPMDAAKGAVDNIKGAFSDFVKSVGPHVQPFLDRVGDAFIRMQPYIVAVISVIGIVGAAFIRLAGPYVGALLDGLGLLIEGFSFVYQAAADMVSRLLNAFADLIGPIAKYAEKLHIPMAKSFVKMANDARDAAGRIQQSLNSSKTDVLRREIDRAQAKINTLKGKKVKTENDKRALAQAERDLRSYQRQINALEGKNVTIGINTIRTTSGSTAPGAHAAGGPIRGPGTSTSDSIPAMLSNGENVFSAADVARLGGQAAVERLKTGRFAGMSQVRAGGSSAVVSIEIDSGGSQMDDLLVAIMRKAVRVKGGGNVQVALGRS